jgi:tetratricopeptide (TPR) repeat protein
MPHQRPATEEAHQSIVKQSEDAARLAELFAAASPLSDQQMVEITCPASARPGEHIEAQTASGRMHVTIPDGVRPGQAFLVRPAPAVGKAHAEVEPPSYHRMTDSLESQYHEQLAAGALLLGQDKFNAAAKAFEEACKLKPECATAYFDLAVTHKRAGDLPQAAALYEIARQAMEHGSEHWATATARIFGCLVQVAMLAILTTLTTLTTFTTLTILTILTILTLRMTLITLLYRLVQMECADVERPAWWHDEGLKALSKQVLELRLRLRGLGLGVGVGVGVGVGLGSALRGGMTRSRTK